MTELQSMLFEDSPVRILMEDGVPWFVAPDVAKILGYRMASDLTRTLEDDELGTRPVRTKAGIRSVRVITEPGLLKALVQRQTGRMVEGEVKERVKRFQLHVTHEILPAVLHTGMYISPAVAASPTNWRTPETWVKLAARVTTEAAEYIAELSAANEALSTKVRVRTEVIDSLSVKDVGTVAKELQASGLFDGGRNKLFEYLREKNWVFKKWDVSSNVYRSEAMQAVIDAGLMEMHSGTYKTRYGTVRPTSRPVFTGKGILRIREMLDPSIPNRLTLEQMRQRA